MLKSILLLVTVPAFLALGASKDSKGCLLSAGFSWCETTKACQRSWETPCPQQPNHILGGDGHDQQPHRLGANGHGQQQQPHRLGANGHGQQQQPHRLGANGHGQQQQPHLFGANGHGQQQQPHRFGADGHGQQPRLIGGDNHRPDMSAYMACKKAQKFVQKNGYQAIDPECLRTYKHVQQLDLNLMPGLPSLAPAPILSGVTSLLGKWAEECKKEGRMLVPENVVDPECFTQKRAEHEAMKSLPSTSNIAKITLPSHLPPVQSKTARIWGAYPSVTPSADAQQPYGASVPMPPANPVPPANNRPRTWDAHPVTTPASVHVPPANSNVRAARPVAPPVNHEVPTANSAGARSNTESAHSIPARSAIQSCRKRCPRTVNAICGSNNRTYANRCFFQVAQCRYKQSRNVDLTVQHTGTCRDTKSI